MGFLEVGLSADRSEVVVNHPDLQPDANGVGHIVFSASEALDFARILIAKAAQCEPARRCQHVKRRPLGPGVEQCGYCGVLLSTSPALPR